MNRGLHLPSVFACKSNRIGLWPAIAAITLCAGCDFFSDLFSPQESSLSSYHGRVFSQIDSTALAGVRVELHNREILSDSNGVFAFSEIATGPVTLHLSKTGFFPMDTPVAVFLRTEATSDTAVFFLQPAQAPPEIDTFFGPPAATRSRDESVVFLMRCRSSKGNIERIVCNYGDGAADTLRPDTNLVTNSFRHVFLSPGEFTVRLHVLDSSGDSAKASANVVVSGNRKPEALLEFPTHPFYANRYDYIGITVNDSDGNFDHLTINWGDATPVETFFTQPDSKQYLHQYGTVPTETRYFVVITLRDESLAQTTYVRSVLVDLLNPPQIENPISVLPHNVLPTDSIITAQVRVFEVEGYVKEILWQLNLRGGVADTIARDTLDAISGSVAGGLKIFAHSFSTNLLRDTTNSVNVRVTDSYGGSSNASTTFFYWPNQ